MNKIKFTRGTMTKISDEYYNLILSNNDSQVYKVTVNQRDAAEIINKYYPKVSLQK
jgi:hypothetical protein